MLPGKVYGPETLLQAFRRHFWLLAVPLAIVSAGAAVVARRLPPRYHAEALILVVPQKVPESFVKSTVTTRLEDRLDTIQQTILTRTRLEKIVTDMNLYPEQRRAGIMQDIVDNMRTNDLHLQIVKGDAFRVSFDAPDPAVAAKVTDRLASLFIEESLRDRANQSEGTSAFLESELEDARRRLIEQEKKLQNFKTKFSGQLPNQLTGNLQSLQNTALQRQSLLESMNKARDRRLIVQRQLAEAQATLNALQAQAAANPGAGAGGNSTADQLAKAQALLVALKEAGDLDTHPDVVAANRRVAELTKKLNEERLLTPVSDAPILTPQERQLHNQINSYNDEIAGIDKQIAVGTEEADRLGRVAVELQKRIDIEPERESDMVELTRDYSTVQSIYNSLSMQKEQSNISANLERRQIGEQFSLLEPAHTPERPINQNAMVITLMGAAIGLGIGLALSVLIEYRDTTLKSTDDVRHVLQVPVLAVVPFMHSEDEKRRIAKRRWIMRVGLGSIVTACLAVVAYTMVR
jgi:polysaccharide chain length determinant protein (PEP-CTERM system associated)